MGRQLTQTTLERYPSTKTLTSTTSYAVTTGNPYGTHVASTNSPGGVTSTYAYNRAGDITSVTDGAGNTTRYAYDFEGNQSKTTLADNTYTTTDYNADGDPTATHSYDASGTQLWNTSQQYDGVGNMTSATDANHHTSQFTYDAAGTITQETQPVDATTSITTTFGYDQAGNQTRFTDGRGNSWRYTYTPWGQQEKEIQPTTAKYTSTADSTTTYAYDADGQLTNKTLPGGVTTSMSYDSMGQLTSVSGSGSDAATATRHFTYDNDGRVLSANTDEAGTVGANDHQASTHEAFTYDDRGGVLTASGSAGSSNFAYNNDGVMTSRTDAAGTTNYGYDTAGRLSSLNDAATGTQLTYTYNQLNQVQTIKYGATGQTRTFGYNAAHELTGDTLVQGASTLASVSYGYDNNGNLTSKATTGVSGASSNTYGYDWANRLTSWGNGSTTTTYGYDASGNRTRNGTSTYTYDERDELTSDGVHSYGYSARGTMTQDSSVSGTGAFKTDAFGNQIVAGNQSYTLDAMGRNITDTDTSTQASRTFQYSGVDNTIASDGDDTYTYDPAGGVIGIKPAGGSGVLALTDQYDDVVGTFTSGATSLAGSVSYSPLGKAVSSNTVTGHLGFQSGWTEPGTGDVGTASRWYNPNTGQFRNKDSISLDAVPNSVSANPFAYVDDNPMAGTDPSGHCSLFDVSCHLKSGYHKLKKKISHGISHLKKGAHSLYAHGKRIVQSARHHTRKIISRAKDYYRATVRRGRQIYKYASSHVRRGLKRAVRAVSSGYSKLSSAAGRTYRSLKHKGRAFVSHAKSGLSKLKKAVSGGFRTAYRATVKAGKTAGTYIKHHTAAVTSDVNNFVDAVVEQLPSLAGHTLEAGIGVAGMVLGAGGEVFGVGLDATGIGAVAGVPINVAAAGAFLTGAGAAGVGAKGLGDDLNSIANRVADDSAGSGGDSTSVSDDGPPWSVDDSVEGPAKGRELKPPNKRHTVSGSKSGEIREKNSVILRGNESLINDDIAGIARGDAKLDGNGNNYEINGRTYRIEESGTVYPVSGPGIVELDRNEYAALQGIGKVNGDMEQFTKTFGRNPRFANNPAAVQKALSVYNGTYK
ncbi:RHS repeat-associated core domain-containing protein [Streptomyces sp. NBC_01483]|uniref:RHS repeat-associated core domain-containing protein n=1 Tax=Streptomyces sp. NBC_01483 TaxID=2903883 RepID=UPI002E2F3579|nr:RHS repeat-associated core domain-containing protein [Streptomyces sp. NBC_01483]